MLNIAFVNEDEENASAFSIAELIDKNRFVLETFCGIFAPKSVTIRTIAVTPVTIVLSTPMDTHHEYSLDAELKMKLNRSWIT